MTIGLKGIRISYQQGASLVDCGSDGLGAVDLTPSTGRDYGDVSSLIGRIDDSEEGLDNARQICLTPLPVDTGGSC